MTDRKEFVGLVDYGVGTWRSVINMLESVGVEAKSFSSPEQIDQFSHIILPGVGNFSAATERLDELGWREALERTAVSGVPFLGICLGMQLLGRSSEESDGLGLGIMKFRSERLSEIGPHRVPHMGWNSVEPSSDHQIFQGWSPDSKFYFVHSYAVPDSEPTAIGVSVHNSTFSSVVAHENIIGVQFHPEKSHRHGKELFSNFIEMS